MGRFKTLQRQEERKRQLPDLIERMSLLSASAITEEDILTLEQIDALEIKGNRSDFGFNYLNINFPIDHIAEMKQVLASLHAGLSQKNYLSLSHTKDIAILDIDTSFAIARFEDIIKFDGDSFSITNHDYTNGIYIDLYQEHWFIDNEVKFPCIYELRVFGKDWIKKVSATL